MTGLGIGRAGRRAVRFLVQAARTPATALFAAVWLAGCAAGGTGRQGPDEPAPLTPPGERPDAETPAVEDPPPATLEGVRSLLESEPARALHAADSLYFTLGPRGDAGVAAEALRIQARAAAATGDTVGALGRLYELLALYPESDPADGAALSLARMLVARTDDPGAVEVLLRRGRSGSEAKSVLRSAAGSMSVSELQAAVELAARTEASGAVRGLLAAELSEALALAGRPDAARRSARSALEGEPDPSDRRTVRSVLDGSVDPSGPVRIGVLLPEAGRYASVGRWVRQGMRIALRGEGQEVEVLARDLSEAAAGELVSELEREGVAAVLGPVRGRALGAAARSRSDPGLLLVSPTAVRSPPGPLHAYALRDRRRRELDAAVALGRWVGRIRPGPVGAIFPEGELGRRAFLGFRRSLGESGGGWLTSSASYDPETTTLETAITEVSAYRPDAVYAGASGTSSLLQMAPQLAYYGVRAAVVAGGPDWTRPGAVRRLDPAFSQYRVGVTFAPPEEAGAARDRFRASYEKEYRTTLGDNVFPMLGHDAALLVLRAAARTSPPRPRALARAFAGLSGVEGATGTLAPDRETGTVRRRVHVRALQERRLRPTGIEEARAWLSSAGRLAEAGARGRRARARRAVRRAEVPLRPSGSESGEGGDTPR